MHNYKKTKSFAARQAEAANMKEKFPDRVCVICDRDKNAGGIGDIDKKKYLVPANLTIGQFMFVIRKRLQLSDTKALFFFLESGTLPATSSTLNQLHSAYGDDDGLLYLTYGTENTFG